MGSHWNGSQTVSVHSWGFPSHIAKGRRMASTCFLCPWSVLQISKPSLEGKTQITPHHIRVTSTFFLLILEKQHSLHVSNLPAHIQVKQAPMYNPNGSFLTPVTLLDHSWRENDVAWFNYLVNCVCQKIQETARKVGGKENHFLQIPTLQKEFLFLISLAGSLISWKKQDASYCSDLICFQCCMCHCINSWYFYTCFLSKLLEAFGGGGGGLVLKQLSKCQTGSSRS